MRSMKFQMTLICTSVLFLTGLGAKSQSEQEKEATLTFHIVSRMVGLLPGGRLLIRSKAGVVAFDGGVTEEKSVHLPYGDYRVSFSGDFLSPVSRQVTIDRPDCFLVLATDMDRVVLDVQHEPVS